MSVRVPHPSDRLVEDDGRPSRIFQAFLRELSAESQETRRRQDRLIAQLLSTGTLPAGWTP